LTVYLKIWQKEKFVQQTPTITEIFSSMKEKEKELHYWQADVEVKNGGGLFQRFRRKLKV
jgi:hypothetical protein